VLGFTLLHFLSALSFGVSFLSLLVAHTIVSNRLCCVSRNSARYVASSAQALTGSGLELPSLRLQ
jgi:hypothetical protein